MPMPSADVSPSGAASRGQDKTQIGRAKTGSSSGWLFDERGVGIFDAHPAYATSKSRKGFWEVTRSHSRILCDSWRFTVLTTVLTIYALFGDDLRLATTMKQHMVDDLFNVMTICCILVFTVEILVNCFGKDEYFLGFFFTLDMGSTVTLLFDLTWVSDLLLCTSDESGDAVRTGRAGRAGARASRTVRIIRLIRLVKLYKSYKAAVESREDASKRRRGGASVAPGDEDGDTLHEDREDELMEGDGSGQSDGEESPSNIGPSSKRSAETRVGRKLSDMTTRRVILLVLIMLFVMPLFTPEEYLGLHEMRSSGQSGLEMVYQRWRSWCFRSGGASALDPWCIRNQSLAVDMAESTPPTERQSNRAWYEHYLLTSLYSHHVGSFAWRLYWVGLRSDELSESDSERHIGRLAQLNQESMLGAENTVPLEDWDKTYAGSDWRVEMEPLSDTVKRRLTEPWTERCLNYHGVTLQSTAGGHADVTSMSSDSSAVCPYEDSLRCSEVQAYVPLMMTEEEETLTSIIFVFDKRGTTQLEAALNMLQTLFICLVVGAGALSFQVDANKLLLNPIERMIHKMETIKDNPLEAIKLGDLEYRREEIEQARRRDQLSSGRGWWRRLLCVSYRGQPLREPMETIILERTIIKLGGLLALGFGEAGAEIIGENMKGGHSAGVNAMVPGRKVDAIIGFCEIQDFADATEVLKETVMVFVNQVSEIVHGCVGDYHGAPNKNIGASFLVVWRLSGVARERQTKLADMAIMSNVRIHAEINKSRVLAEYRLHPGLQQRVRDYRVALNFGLHCGWAIEGAIGSQFKIDASYLSPNVNVAARLEAATKQFHVWILVSHFMINLCSQEMAVHCRLIDRVTVKGSRQPIRLYTIDMDCLQLRVEPPPRRRGHIERAAKNRFKMRQMREASKSQKWAEECKVWDEFEADEDLIAMRSTYSTEFFQRFSMAYRNYEAGEWLVARDMLLTCHYEGMAALENCAGIGTLAKRPADGPTLTLLAFMERTAFSAPASWPGYRELTEK